MTAESSSSSDVAPAATAAEPAAGGERPSAPKSRCLIDVRDLGIWYRLHKKYRTSLKRNILRFRFRREHRLLWALRGITFQCKEGEALGIVGHNGAGKSTLCLALANILVPDEGTADLDGRVSALLTLGAGLHPDLSGTANIRLYAAFLGIPRKIIDQKMQEIIEFAELGDFIDEPVRSYSTGMRARLGFSVVTALDPEILILDEVLSVGDQAFRLKSQQRMHQMIERSKCIVIVSHSVSMLRELCSHCLWLDHGRMRMYGEAGRILEAYERAMT